jgi:hypothetical protein
MEHDGVEAGSFRDRAWARFERDLTTWLESGPGRFATYCAERERELEDELAATLRLAITTNYEREGTCR